MCDKHVVTHKPVFTRSLGYIASIKDSKTSKIDIARNPLFENAFFSYAKTVLDLQALKFGLLQYFSGKQSCLPLSRYLLSACLFYGLHVWTLATS